MQYRRALHRKPKGKPDGGEAGAETGSRQAEERDKLETRRPHGLSEYGCVNTAV